MEKKKKEKEEKSLKIPINLVSGTLENLQKIHNKEYIYIYTQIIYINISIYTAEPQERLRKA